MASTDTSESGQRTLPMVDVLRLPAVGTARPARRPGLGVAVFLASLVLYLGAGAILVLVFQVVNPQALSRVGNAYYVLFSRDPHLAAIGFVDNPLPSLLMLPLLPLKALWPGLVQLGFAANLVSATFMAATVYQLYRLLGELGVTARWRALLTLLFAIHPAVVYYAASGMPEAIVLFFLVLSVRSLAQWLRDGELWALVIAGAALSAAVLTRSEALSAAAGAVLLVLVVSFRRTPDVPAHRLRTALVDAIIVASPVVLTFSLWLSFTWIITGDPLQQLSSVYGVVSRLQALTAFAPHDTGALLPVLLRLLLLAPGLLVVIACLIALNRARHPGAAAVIAVTAPILLVAAAAQVAGLTLDSLHAFIPVVPLTIMLAGAVVAAAGSRARLGVLGPLLVLALCLAIPTSIAGMVTRSVAPDEATVFRPIVAGAAGRGLGGAPSATLVNARAIAEYLDRLRLPDGSVLVDSFTGFPVVLSSVNAHQFVITNDRDFRLALSDPGGTRVRYLLVPDPSSAGSVASLDALNRAYPDLYRSGAALGGLLREFDGSDGATRWRLYEVLES
jgi:dolichyl-phosphate-mannose-protein mannosyltransferase